MSTPSPQEVISYLLPYLATAGTYSARIQGQVGVHDAKDGDTPFHHALSDADLTIQAFLEVVLLARFPQLRFYSEEQDRSLNKRYFAGTAELEVLLDPIDGTRPYIDNRTNYQIIVTLHNEREITGAICYMPRRDRCYVASKGNGAYELNHNDVVTGSPGKRLSLNSASGPILLFNSPVLVRRLSGVMETIDLVDAYTERPGEFDPTDILSGKAAAVVHQSCQAIDGGAIAFIATEAGAIMTDFAGNPPVSFRTSEKRTIPEIVVSTNKAIHDRILRALAAP